MKQHKVDSITFYAFDVVYKTVLCLYFNALYSFETSFFFVGSISRMKTFRLDSFIVKRLVVKTL